MELPLDPILQSLPCQAAPLPPQQHVSRASKALSRLEPLSPVRRLLQPFRLFLFDLVFLRGLPYSYALRLQGAPRHHQSRSRPWCS